MPTNLDQMESRLREVYGTSFDGMYKETLAEYGGARRGALNALRTREVEDALSPSLYVSSFARMATRGENKGKVTQVSFRLLTPDGRPALVIAARDSLDYVKSKFPDIDGKLVPVSLKPVMKREDVISGATTFFVIPGKTVLEPVKDNGKLDFTLEVLPIAKAVERQATKPKTQERDPFSIVYGEIADSRVIVDRETGELLTVKVTLRDMDGEEISSRFENNLEEVLGEQPWIDEPDAEKISNSLRGLPVLVGGKVFIGHEGDELTNRKTKEVTVLEADVTSFVVKNGGYVVNLETVAPSVYQAVMKALDKNDGS